MNEIRLAALDLDGTLLDRTSRITPRTLDALTEAIRRGVVVLPATGRALSSLPRVAAAIPGVRYAVTSNGAAVYRIADSACILSRRLSRSAAEQALKLSERLISVPVVEFFAAPWLIELFRKGDPEVTRIGALALRLQCLTFPLAAWVTGSMMFLY